MDSRGIKPELECFDKGMIDMVLKLNKKGHIKEPMHFNFVLGVNGGIAATPSDLLFMVNSIPKNSTFTVCAIGRHDVPLEDTSFLWLQCQ